MDNDFTLIHKDKRNRGYFFHKQPKGMNVTKAKKQAMLDISKECKEENGIYNMNYIHIERQVLICCNVPRYTFRYKL